MSVLTKPSYKFIANILPFQLVTVYTGNYADTFLFTGKVIRFKMILFYSHPLVHRERNRYNIL